MVVADAASTSWKMRKPGIFSIPGWPVPSSTFRAVVAVIIRKEVRRCRSALIFEKIPLPFVGFRQPALIACGRKGSLCRIGIP